MKNSAIYRVSIEAMRLVTKLISLPKLTEDKGLELIAAHKGEV